MFGGALAACDYPLGRIWVLLVITRPAAPRNKVVVLLASTCKKPNKVMDYLMTLCVRFVTLEMLYVGDTCLNAV